MPVRERRQRGRLRDQTEHLVAARLLVENPLGIGVERRQRADGADEHAHRMGVVVKAVDELLDVLVDDRVVRDVIHPGVELRGAGQLPLQQEERRLEEGALLGELLDRIAAIAQDALIAVDETDRAAAGGGIHERRIVAHQPEIVGGGFDLTQVSGPNRPILNGKLVTLARAVVDDAQRVLRHSALLGSWMREAKR